MWGSHAQVRARPAAAVRRPLTATGAPSCSFWQRLNALFFYALSVLGFLAFMAAGTTYWHQPDPRIQLSLKKQMLCVRGRRAACVTARARARSHSSALSLRRPSAGRARRAAGRQSCRRA